MAYDEVLAARIRDLVGEGAAVTEKKMFGGLAFLVGGNMAVAASGQGGLLVRVDPAESDALVEATPAAPRSTSFPRGNSLRRISRAAISTRPSAPSSSSSR